MKKIIFLIFIFASLLTRAQTKYTGFFELSHPKRVWVFFHVFKAKKSFRISQEVTRISDSIKGTNLLDGDASGGQVDAFRHAFWMAKLKQEVGECTARSLGKAHEKENYITFKKNELEDGVVPDEISSEMDLYNNEQGLKLISKDRKVDKDGLIYKIVNAIRNGDMKIIKKDKKGNFLTCEGTIISTEALKGKWKNNKCLVDSNQ